MSRNAIHPDGGRPPQHGSRDFVDTDDGCCAPGRPSWPRAALRLGGLSLLGWTPLVALLLPLFS